MIIKLFDKLDKRRIKHLTKKVNDLEQINKFLVDENSRLKDYIKEQEMSISELNSNMINLQDEYQAELEIVKIARAEYKNMLAEVIKMKKEHL